MDTPAAPLSRRGALTLLGLGGLGLMSSPASAKQEKEWKTDVDANGRTLFNLGALEMINDPVIETTDGSPLDLRLNGKRALRLDPTPEGTAANIIGGHTINSIAEGVEAATIAGGGADDGSTAAPNTVTGDFGTVSGGRGNTAGGAFSTVSGGNSNRSPANLATIGGGRNNVASGRDGTVGGGSTNKATGDASTIGGGGGNKAAGENATIRGVTGTKPATRTRQSAVAKPM